MTHTSVWWYLASCLCWTILLACQEVVVCAAAAAAAVGGTIVIGNWDIPVDGNPIPPMTAHVGDTILWSWPGFHNIYQMSSLTAFSNCDFETAERISLTSPANYTFTQENIGTVYFGCQEETHCHLGMKLAVVVSPPPHKNSFQIITTEPPSSFAPTNVPTTLTDPTTSPHLQKNSFQIEVITTKPPSSFAPTNGPTTLMDLTNAPSISSSAPLKRQLSSHGYAILLGCFSFLGWYFFVPY